MHAIIPDMASQLYAGKQTVALAPYSATRRLRVVRLVSANGSTAWWVNVWSQWSQSWYTDAISIDTVDIHDEVTAFGCSLGQRRRGFPPFPG
jgi:hypothetical protein